MPQEQQQRDAGNGSAMVIQQNSKVTLALVIAVFAGLGGIWWSITERLLADQARDSKRLAAIEELRHTTEMLSTKIVGKGPNGWHRQQMKAWVRSMELLNPDISFEPVDNVSANSP